MTTVSGGVHQSDAIIRSALTEGLALMRRDPWLLDWVFLGLLQDSLTVKEFGQKQVREAREWFLKTKVNVYHGLGVVEPEFPAIDIILQSTEESEKTLGDLNHDIDEALGTTGPALTLEFVPVSFDPLNLVMVLPQDIRDSVYLNTHMVVQDRAGKLVAVTEVRDDDSLVLASAGDFRTSTLRYLWPNRVALEGVQVRESYQLGIHVQGPPLYLMVLHSIVQFVLWRYKQSLLEARNFAETTFSSTDFSRNSSLAQEAEYSRYMVISGTVRQYWPKDVSTPATTVEGGLRVIDGERAPLEPGETVNDLLWMGEQDSLTIKTGG